MRRGALLIALWLSLLPLNAPAVKTTADMADTNYINRYVGDMVKNHQPAFVSTCVAHSASVEYIASIVFFPRKNQGMFIFSDKNHVVLNWGNLSWTQNGQWDMNDLEGGIDTIRILNDLAAQLIRLPFLWASPEDVKHVLTAKPRNSCTLLSG